MPPEIEAAVPHASVIVATWNWSSAPRLARVRMHVPALRRPCDLDPACSDRRRPGVALRWAEIVPGGEPEGGEENR